MLCAGPDEAQMAIPLSQITRLEEFPRSTLEGMKGQPVVQYFGDILPLVSLGDLLAAGPAIGRSPTIANEETVSALVYAKDGRHVGVVVNRILDTIEQSLGDLRPSTREGVMGSLVIQGRVTELLDLDTLCAGRTTSAQRPADPLGI
jgi:two-component system chemotaxis sensor kinase CheA